MEKSAWTCCCRGLVLLPRAYICRRPCNMTHPTPDSQYVRKTGLQIILWCSTSPPLFSARSAESWVRSSVFGIQGTLGPLLGAQDSVLCSGWGAFCSMLDTENLTARQSARRKGEAKVGKGGKGEFLDGEIVSEMLLSLYCFPTYTSISTSLVFSTISYIHHLASAPPLSS